MRNIVTVGVLWLACACGSEPPFDPQSVPPQYREVAEIHHAKCGGCHKRVEPGKRTRDKLEKALVKHRRRVNMSEQNWSLLVDYLAQSPAPAASAQAPTTPR